MVDDADDGQITGIGLATSGLAGSRTANADDPVTGYTTHRINRHFLGAAIEHDLQVLVLKITNAISGHQGFDNLANQHLSGPLLLRM